MICWLNGKLVEPEHATVSVFDHGLLYGDGVFEGLRFYNNNVFRGADHLQRLFESAKALSLRIPYSMQALRAALELTLTAYPKDQGYLRLVVTRGKGALGINPRSCELATVFIIADELNFAHQDVYENGARLITASTRRLPSDGVDSRIKSLNYLNNILARIEANHANADEAILLNQQGKVAEGTSDNIFIVKRNTLLTPPTSDGALAGITRNAVIDIAKIMELHVNETSLSLFDLYNADECFLTGTAVELLPVREIDGRKISTCPGPIYKRLNQQLAVTIRQETNG